MSTNTPIFSVRHLCCIRGDRELFSDLNFSLEPQDILHISGANGSGKTSLLRILCGLSRPEKGDVFWQNRSIFAGRSRFSGDLRYIGHLGGIKPELSPWENLVYFAALSGQVKKSAIETVIEQLGLSGFEHEPAYRLSSGQCRRIALSRLLLNPAKIWILDEPFTALDAAGCELLVTLVDGQLQSGGLVIFASHSHTDLFPRHIQTKSIRLIT